jgi:hypothetical protein
MIYVRLPYARRQTTFVLVWLLLCAMAASAREFKLQTLSESNSNARLPSIGETGLVAWQAYSANASDVAMIQRPDVISGGKGFQRSDIILWRDGQVMNITAPDTRIGGRSERPQVFSNSIIFTAWFNRRGEGGLPANLSIPTKTDEMNKMEDDYPELFEPPLPEPKSALEAEAAAGETNPPPADPAAEAAADSQKTNQILQHQIWRHGGAAGDIAVYQPDGNVERISPGTYNFSMPAMSEAGIAFQCARGWPYGYEMLAWKPGATNLIQLTTNYFYVLNADMHGNELVFQAWDGDDYEIFLYRFDTEKIEQITNNQFDDISPVVWNGQIAWVAHPTVTAEIFLLSEGGIRKISEGTEDNSAPSIWQDRIVWQGYDDTDLEILYFNGRRTIKLTSNTWDDMSPKIRDGVITWMSYVDNWDSEIMALDLGDNVASQLTDNEFEDSFPQTAGEKIVWQTISDGTSIIQMAAPAAPRAAPVN